MRVRFAPSPTGHLHVGNARTALFNWLLARRHGGTFILRIEDTDAGRSTRQSELTILEDLRWLGLDWDEGLDRGGGHGPYRQSERLATYQKHAADLIHREAAYFCFCSPEKLEADRRAALAAGRPLGYPGTCRMLDRTTSRARVDRGETAAIRLRVPSGRDVRFDDAVRGLVSFATDVIGDPIIVRADGWPAYNFAVVVDDGLMAVTHVVRGEDHISNTPRQLLVYEALGWLPPTFAHLSLVLGPDHAPLSKRHGATSVAEFRAKGYLPEALANYLALLGWSPGDDEELLPLRELARRFELGAVAHRAAVFDEAKLAWANRHYLKLVSSDRLVTLSLPFLQARGFVAGQVSDEGRLWLEYVLAPAAAAVERLEQIGDRLELVFTFDEDAALSRPEVREALGHELARGVLGALVEELDRVPPLTDRERFRDLAARIRARTGAKGKALFHPMRLALTGRADGPELDALVPAIERGAELPAGSGIAPIRSCRERAGAMMSALDR